MIDRLTNWIKRRSDHHQVFYSRFGCPGDVVDDRPAPKLCHVAHFDDDAPEYRMCFMHSTRAAAISAGFVLACTLLMFGVLALGGRLNVPRFVVPAIIVLLHGSVLLGIKRENAICLVPSILVYSIMIAIEIFYSLYMAASNPSLKYLRPNEVLSYLAGMGIQTAMLLSFIKARRYLEAKDCHKKEVQVAVLGKRENPEMQILYVKKADHVAPLPLDSDYSVMTSPSPRVILSANDNITN